jgi:hypothetical protein
MVRNEHTQMMLVCYVTLYCFEQPTHQNTEDQYIYETQSLAATFHGFEA